MATGVRTKDIPVSADLDILFVIDNSRSTRDKQQLFAQNYKNFVDRLESFPTRPNMHLGVVTTSIDVGGTIGGASCHDRQQNGLLQNKPLDPSETCAAPTDDRFLSDLSRPDGTRQINYTPPLDAALSCISHVGESGCGFETPLEAMKRALDGSRPENQGFLRDGAYLAVVILTDEDDCSANSRLFTEGGTDTDFRCVQPAYRCDQAISGSKGGDYTNCEIRRDTLLTDPQAYVNFLTALKGPGHVVVALIGGDPEKDVSTGELKFQGTTQPLSLLPSCTATIAGQPTIARPANRLEDFRKAFGDHGLFATVCQSDYGQAVADIGTLLFQAISPCLLGALDTTDLDPATPGLQPDCTVTDIMTPSVGAPVETVVPPCAMRGEDQPDRGGDSACWWVKVNPTCATETQLELQLERAVAPAPGTTTRVSCVTTLTE